MRENVISDCTEAVFTTKRRGTLVTGRIIEGPRVAQRTVVHVPGFVEQLLPQALRTTARLLRAEKSVRKKATASIPPPIKL